MKRSTNIINNIIYFLITMATLFLVVVTFNQRYNEGAFLSITTFVIGAIMAGIINTFAHEFGHYFAGKKNGFVFSCMCVWFFKWTKVNKQVRFNFVMIGEEAGYTEMIPTSKDSLDRKFARMTRGGIIASLLMLLIGIPPIFIKSLPSFIYAIWSIFLPIGCYYFFGSFLPTSSEGILNDGAVIRGIKKKYDTMTVALSILAIQSEMYNGKTPSEIDEGLYFNLPQLPEDDPNFALLLDARYCYYLDNGDYENAKKASDRMLSIVEYMPKNYKIQAKLNCLYNACTFDYNEDVADDIMYDIERFLNNVNTASTVRVKLAYLINIKGEIDSFDIFYKKGLKEADRCQIKGLGRFERKLFERLKADYEKK